MKSKLAIAVILWGWLLFAAWFSYDYAEHGNRVFIHIFRESFSLERVAFYILVILVPFVYTVLGYVINERLKLLGKLQELERYKALALVDEVTNLLNRRGFSFLAEQQLKLAARNGKGQLLVYIDVDELKKINDTFGHHVGDMALIDVANVVKDNFRKSDIVARIGGDEFAVLAIETSWAVSDIFAMRLKNNLVIHNEIEARPFELSFSIGFSYFDPGSPCSLDELIERADANMYEVKQRKYDKDE
jgi:diguanylate cyclase (GGDEF)-like protein